MGTTNTEGDFFRPQMSVGMKVKESLRRFVFFLMSRGMLIFYVASISLTLVVLAPILVANNFNLDSEEPTSLGGGSCRLKEGFMIDCIPQVHDSEIRESLCTSLGCCYKFINKGKEAPLCHRRSPSARSFSISSDSSLLPSHANEEDTDNSPLAGPMAYRVASLTPGHVVIRLCSEKGKGQCQADEDESNVDASNLNVNLHSKDNNRLEIVVTRQRMWNSTTLFDSSKGAIIMGQKMTEISTLLSSPFIYGLGGHPASFNPSRASNFTFKSLFGSNLKDFPQRTSIKSFIGIDERKGFYGVVMESQTPVESELLPGLEQKKPLLVFRSMGGEVSFHLFSGPKPSDVLLQMAKLFGAPKIPPKWVLGIHLCRQNGDLFSEDTIESEHPYDSDCLDRSLLKSGFSLKYPADEIKKKVNLLKKSNKKFILTNPLPVEMKTRTHALQFIQDSRTKTNLVGSYMNLRNVSIPDLVDNADEWEKAITNLFKKTTAPDAFHISDNAPDLKLRNSDDCKIYFSHKELRSVFNDNLCHLYNFGSHISSSKSHSDIRDDYPRLSLEKSESSSSNLFSDFASLGIQKHGWILSPGYDSTDRNEWDLLRHDLQMTLELGLSGIPLRSMNPCTTDDRGKIRNEDACYRWFFLATYMPALNTLRVSPLSFSSGQYKKWLKRAFENRYKLHPYYYTTMANKETLGEPLIRPLFYEFPWDPKTYDISHQQVMIGESLLLTPVMSQSSHENQILSVYFPQGTWYDLGSGAITVGENRVLQVTCFKFHTPVFLRRGKIIPSLEKSGSSLEEAYDNHFSLIIGMDCDFSPAMSEGERFAIKDCSAQGKMFLEKDKELVFEAKRNAKEGRITIKPPPSQWSSCGSSKSIINSVVVYGITDSMKKLSLSNGHVIPVETDDINGQATYTKDYNRLQVKNLNLDFCDSLNDLVISWTFTQT